MPRVKAISSSQLAVSKTKKAKSQKPKANSLSVPVYSLTGRTTRTISLPKEIFGQSVNEKLLAQAVRVYSTNQKNLLASTKTRGEVEGSTAKISRQKGTGRARHGSIRAPIFVGGGIVFGPKPRKVRLELPKAMKKSALISALSSKASEKNILGLTGLEKASGKTKEIYELLKKISDNKEIKSTLIVTADRADNVIRAVRNISRVNVLPASGVNAYEILKHQLLLLTKEAVDSLTKPVHKEEAK